MFGHGREFVTDDLVDLVQSAAGAAYDAPQLATIPAVPAQEDFARQVVFAGKMPVDSGLSHSSRISDFTHAGAVDSSLGEQRGRGPYDHWPLRLRLLLQGLHCK